MPSIARHDLASTGGATVELFQASPDRSEPSGAILFVHGNQGGSRLGAREFVDGGILEGFSAQLGITAAAVSQPGYGASAGRPDFCGPATQRAVHEALRFLRSQRCVDPTRIVLYGISRGAIVSGMVAAQDPDLAATVLASGIYDLAAAYRTALPGIRQAIESEAGTTDETFAARSALLHADRFRSEILILHGRHDDRAPVAQAEQLARAASRAGVAVSLTLLDCGHRIPGALSRAALRPMLKRIFRPAGPSATA